jgi:hypothetical protein
VSDELRAARGDRQKYFSARDIYQSNSVYLQIRDCIISFEVCLNYSVFAANADEH